jgi:hypothetical protein
VACGPDWCRASENNSLQVQRINGRDMQVLAPNAGPVGQIEAAHPNFEVYSSGISSGPSSPIRDLFVHDLAGNRSALVARGAGDVGARANYVLWSTGSDEAKEWHFLDLRSLS